VSAANRQEPGSPFADACGSKEARGARFYGTTKVVR
jgi:hypothetical protein